MDTFNDYPSRTPKELLEAASAGDRRAFDELKTRYNGPVSRSTHTELRRQGCNLLADHSPDIIESAWFTMIVNGNQLKANERFEGWAYVIISHLVSRHVSGNNGCISLQKRTDQLDPTRPPHIESTDDIIEEGLLINELLNRASEQSPMFGDIVRLHLIEGYTLKEVAEMLGQPYTKLRSFYYRHLYDLRKFFKGDRKGEDDKDVREDGGDDSDDSHVH